MFGPPNDEAFEGHPLAKLGLQNRKLIMGTDP
jgi:hypothetical protein